MDAKPEPNPIWLFITKIASPIVIITIIVLAVKEVPGVLDFLKWAFDNAGPSGQIAMVVIAGIGLIYFALLSMNRENRVAELKAERDSMEERLRLKEAELKQIEENNIRLAEEGVKEDIWRREASGVARFIDKSERKTRFISLLNLKGGVGKTTLAANLGVTLALMDKPLKVLLIDLDFQATLSNMSVDAGILLTASQMGSTTSRLLDPTLTVEEFRKMLVKVNQVAATSILIADVGLDRMDFQAQAKFFLEPKCDVRFLFRSIFHHREITDMYDVVIFDCPPRLTPSTVNALTTSDYVLIPTKLDERSFEAIPRTLTFIHSLRTIAQPKILGVVANEVQFWRRPKLIKIHHNGMAKLKQVVGANDPDLHVFEAMVELSTNDAFGRQQGIIPAVDDRARTDLFLKVADELRKRIGK